MKKVLICATVLLVGCCGCQHKQEVNITNMTQQLKVQVSDTEYVAVALPEELKLVSTNGSSVWEYDDGTVISRSVNLNDPNPEESDLEYSDYCIHVKGTDRVTEAILKATDTTPIDGDYERIAMIDWYPEEWYMATVSNNNVFKGIAMPGEYVDSAGLPIKSETATSASYVDGLSYFNVMEKASTDESMYKYIETYIRTLVVNDYKVFVVRGKNKRLYFIADSEGNVTDIVTLLQISNNYFKVVTCTVDYEDYALRAYTNYTRLEK